NTIESSLNLFTKTISSKSTKINIMDNLRHLIIIFAISMVTSLTHAQNVGIGTANPGQELDVIGAVRGDTVMANQTITIGDDAALYDVNLPNGFKVSGIGNGGAGAIRLGDDAQIQDVNLPNTLGISGQTVANQGGLLLGDGLLYGLSTNIGVGETNPLFKLDVNGDIRSQTGQYWGEVGGGCIKYMKLQEDGNLVLYFNNGAFGGWASGTNCSDIRLKENIVTMEEVLPNLMSLSTIRYNFKEETGLPEGPQIGLSAQELLKFYPEIVGYLDNIDQYVVHYDKLSPILLKGIQEQQNQIVQLQQEIAALKSEVGELKTQASKTANFEDQLKAITAALESSGIPIDLKTSTK
ncbi:MAG: hypothetical protein ACI89M_001140, partial [Chitinophagales bacterium]